MPQSAVTAETRTPEDTSLSGDPVQEAQVRELEEESVEDKDASDAGTESGDEVLYERRI